MEKVEGTFCFPKVPRIKVQVRVKVWRIRLKGQTIAVRTVQRRWEYVPDRKKDTSSDVSPQG